jgi:hypothetical protein
VDGEGHPAADPAPQESSATDGDATPGAAQQAVKDIEAKEPAPSPKDVEDAFEVLQRSDPGVVERVVSVTPSLAEGFSKAFIAWTGSATAKRQLEAETEESKRRHETQAARDEARSKLEVMRFQRVDSLEARVRAGLALLLVVGTGVAVILGVAMGVAPARLTQYLAPITGLAGIAVGYFFGRGVPTSEGSSRAERSPNTD